MKNYLKQNKVNIIIFVIIFTITSAIYFPLLKGHYATDTYNIINKGYEIKSNMIEAAQQRLSAQQQEIQQKRQQLNMNIKEANGIEVGD